MKPNLPVGQNSKRSLVYLSSPSVLMASRRGVPFRLYVAAEDKVIGAVLTQEIDKENIIPSTYEHLPEDIRLMLEERKKKRDEEDLQAALARIKVDRRDKITKIKEIDFASTSSDASTEVDQNHFPVYVLELNNPKALVRPSQAESTKGRNIVIGDERPEKKLAQKIPQGAKTIGGQDKKKKADNKSTGLTGHSGGLTGYRSDRSWDRSDRSWDRSDRCAQ